MNNTTTNLTAIVAVFIAATLVVGTFATVAITTQSAFAIAKRPPGHDSSKKKTRDGNGSGNGNANTITLQKCKQLASGSGFDNTEEQECENLICTHPGENATCVQEGVTSTLQTANLVVCKVVKDLTDLGHLDPASAFTLQVIGNNPSQSSFPGSPPPTCTTVTLGAGGFQVREVGAALATGSDADFCNSATGLGKDVISSLVARSLNLHNIYCVNFSQGCSGTIAAGETRTCTVTNTAVNIG
jgi:hypothetical protein